MRKSKRIISRIDDEMLRLLDAMDDMDCDSAEYKAAQSNLTRLQKVKDGESGGRVRKDTIISGLIGLAGIGAIIVAEQAGMIMNSRAMNFVKKPR